MNDIKGLVVPWQWVQPRDRNELKKRLAEARDFNVHERERENLCSCALIEIEQLEAHLSSIESQKSAAYTLKIEELPVHTEAQAGYPNQFGPASPAPPTSLPEEPTWCEILPEGTYAKDDFEAMQEWGRALFSLLAQREERIEELKEQLKASPLETKDSVDCPIHGTMEGTICPRC